MNKEALLKLIAESGYNIGYAAKKHLATYDIVEKLPGWIAVVSLATGIFALFVPKLAINYVSAIFLVIGIASLFINFYTEQKDQYAAVGSDLTTKFHELRVLYQFVKSMPNGQDLTQQLTDMQRIQVEAQQINLKKQIFLSDWYAHYKFFWQSQTGWMNEQLAFRLIRDKLPLGFTAIMLGGGAWLIVQAIPHALSFFHLCQASL